jgi:hypothetical protein
LHHLCHHVLSLRLTNSALFLWLFSHTCLFLAAVAPFQNFPTTQVTFVAWVRMSYLLDDPGTLVGFGTPTLVNGVAFLVSSITGALVAKIGGNTYYGNSANILDDSWHMLSMSWKASTGTVNFYVDETLLQSLSSVYNNVLPASTGCLSVGRLGTASCSTSTGFPSYVSSYSQEIGQVCGAGGGRGRTDAILFAVCGILASGRPFFDRFLIVTCSRVSLHPSWSRLNSTARIAVSDLNLQPGLAVEHRAGVFVVMQRHGV